MSKVFRIAGADAKTGADRTIRVRADDEKQALAVAKQNGVLPYNVERDKAAEKEHAEKVQAAEEEERVRREEAEQERRILSRISEIKDLAIKRISTGHPVFLYETTYVPVDSILLDEHLSRGFDIPKLRLMGLLGWEVVQVIPRTVGVGLKNTTIGSTMGTTWGGGSGGNVVGVHVILKRPLQHEEITADPEDEFGTYIRANLGSFAVT